MNDRLTTFLIVLLAAVGVISLRRVWREIRHFEKMNTSFIDWMQSDHKTHHLLQGEIECLLKRITELEKLK